MNQASTLLIGLIFYRKANVFGCMTNNICVSAYLEVDGKGSDVHIFGHLNVVMSEFVVGLGEGSIGENLDPCVQSPIV